VQCFKKHKSEYDPILVEEIYDTAAKSNANLANELKSKKSSGIHLIVFVHGFQASALDMRTFKNYVMMKNPKVMCYSSQANEEATEGSIERMGKNLAKEMRQYIKEWCYAKDKVTMYLHRLSFIGHSLGGIIIRAALPYLEDYKELMYGYLSLGSPHLGYLAS